MGIFDFLKESGEDLEKQEREMEKGKSEALTRQVQILGLKVEDLVVDFDDGVATVSGTTPSQQEREKVILVLGNTMGVARVDDQLVVEVAEPEATLYTVKSGDSLSKIAKAHYGNAMKYPVIFEANKPMLKDPDKIYPGQVSAHPGPGRLISVLTTRSKRPCRNPRVSARFFLRPEPAQFERYYNCEAIPLNFFKAVCKSTLSMLSLANCMTLGMVIGLEGVGGGFEFLEFTLQFLGRIVFPFGMGRSQFPSSWAALFRWRRSTNPEPWSRPRARRRIRWPH